MAMTKEEFTTKLLQDQKRRKQQKINALIREAREREREVESYRNDCIAKREHRNWQGRRK